MPGKDTDRALEESTRRWLWAGLVVLALFILIFPIYRIYEPASRAQAQEEQSGYLALQGLRLFESDCESCHGVAGRGGLAPALGAKEFLESVDDDQISQLIALGIPGTEMVSYSLDYGGPLTSEEIKAVTTYLRSLEEGAESNPNWRTPLANEDLSGEDIFALACARCHGVDRKGIEDVAPDISMTSFTLEESDEWIADRIREGKDEMPRFGGVLNDDQINLIIAFLRGVPPDQIGVTTTTIDNGQTGTTQPTDSGPSAEVLAQGKEIFEVTAGGEGCASCHGFDAGGTGDGPNIIGASKSAINVAMRGGVLDMDDIKLGDDELEAVYQYLRTLSSS